METARFAGMSASTDEFAGRQEPDRRRHDPVKTMDLTQGTLANKIFCFLVCYIKI